MRLREVRLDVLSGVRATAATVTTGDRTAPAECEMRAGKAIVRLEEELVLNAGDVLEVKVV